MNHQALARILAATALAALATGCAVVPGDPYYYPAYHPAAPYRVYYPAPPPYPVPPPVYLPPPARLLPPPPPFPPPLRLGPPAVYPYPYPYAYPPPPPVIHYGNGGWRERADRDGAGRDQPAGRPAPGDRPAAPAQRPLQPPTSPDKP